MEADRLVAHGTVRVFVGRLGCEGAAVCRVPRTSPTHPMNTPTHEAVAHCAHQLWHTYGCPSGCDTSIWLEAEREVAARLNEPPVHPAGHPLLLKLSECRSAVAHAESAAHQRKEAREPIVPRITAPVAKPPELGKPLWNQPHSS